MSNKKNPKEASQLFHDIMKASVSFKTPGVFGKKDNVLRMSINSKDVCVVHRGGGFHTIYLNNEIVSSNFLKETDNGLYKAITHLQIRNEYHWL